MTDAATRALERLAAQGDDEARLALGAQRVREGRCPWCGDGSNDAPDPGFPGICCCIDCALEERDQGRRKLLSSCDGCPAKHIDDEQSKEDK